MISVVIPVHGVEDYLDRCLDSVLGPVGLADSWPGRQLARPTAARPTAARPTAIRPTWPLAAAGPRFRSR